MRATIAVGSHFEASHLVAGHPVCGRMHGHTFDVEITVEGQISPKTGTVTDSAAVAAALTKLTSELDHRDLNTMLPAVVPLPEGIASWIREQLLLEFPQIVAVMVGIEDYEARLEWFVR